MAKYLVRIALTSEGVRVLRKEGAASRRALAAKFAKTVGGKLEAYYFAFGSDDVIAIADLPDNVSAAAISVAANSLGLVNGTFTPLLTVEEMDKALAKAKTFPAPK